MLPPALTPLQRKIGLEVLDAAVREAEIAAHLVDSFLRDRGLVPAQTPGAPPVELPAGFLLELGAILRIASWEGAGLAALLDPGLPRAEEAYTEFVRRLMHEPETFCVPGRPDALMDRVFRASLRLVRSGRRHLGADVVASPVDEDAALDALAQFLFANRRRVDARPAS